MPVTRFEDLGIWKHARDVNRRVYDVTRSPEVTRDFALVDQMPRASLPTMNNIAEGFDRLRRAEVCRYLSISRGSAGEVRSMLHAAFDAGHIDQVMQDDLRGDVENLAGSMGSFRTRLEQSPPRGSLRPVPDPTTKD